MTKNEQELQFLADAVATAKMAKAQMIEVARRSGKVVDFEDLRRLDMDIKMCEDELKRSKKC